MLGIMDAERFRDLELLFERAVDLDAFGREELLADLKSEDPALAQRLEAMLATDSDAADVLSDIISAPDGDDRRAVPDKIGPFRVLKKLGEGGMGVVYLGQRKTADFEQLLAIKRRPTTPARNRSAAKPLLR